MVRYSFPDLYAKLPNEIRLMIWEYVAASMTPRVHLVPWLCPRLKNHAHRKSVERWTTYIYVRKLSPSMPDLRQACYLARNFLTPKWGEITRYNPCRKSRIAVFHKMNNLAIDLEWDLVYHNQNWMSTKGNNSIFSASYLNAANIAVKYFQRTAQDECRFHHEFNRAPGGRDVCYQCLSEFANRFQKLKRFYLVVEAQLAYMGEVQGQEADRKTVLMKGPPIFESPGGHEFAVIAAPSTGKIPPCLEDTHKKLISAFQDLRSLRRHYLKREDAQPCAPKVQFMIILANR
ncbi:hypothetical protein QBC44DRAFT_384098 [Cladorrhinum sp. PSN332]|nr:hypothetical protein QBC44DRAFT_384098 [Cladorrhinum sp. PSN332]